MSNSGRGEHDNQARRVMVHAAGRGPGHCADKENPATAGKSSPGR